MGLFGVRNFFYIWLALASLGLELHVDNRGGTQVFQYCIVIKCLLYDSTEDAVALYLLSRIVDTSDLKSELCYYPPDTDILDPVHSISISLPH